LEDVRVPISYKNMVASKLWEKEDEWIKQEVRLWHQTDTTKTVYNTKGEERLELVHEYSKCLVIYSGCPLLTITPRNTSALHRNMGNILRNIDRKCAGRGIMWVTCLSPLTGRKPIGYL